MVSGRASACTCSRSLYLLPSLLSLYSILPSSSYAQVTEPSDASPSTLQTSTTSSSPNSSPTPTQTRQKPNNASPTSPTSSNDSTNGRTNPGTFNYYFIIVAIIIILCILAMLYYGKHKKQKAALMRSNSQRALAEDVEGLRNRFGMGRGAMRRAHSGGGVETERRDLRTEGLDLRGGEAPPPYNPGSKPPSLRSGEGIGRGVGVQAVEMTTISNVNTTGTPRHDPPGYGQETSTGGGGNAIWADMDMARPAPAMTARPRRERTTT